MAYETEKNRIATLLTQTVGIQRLRDADLDREAQERAREVRDETGLYIETAPNAGQITHPTQAERVERLDAPSTVYTAELAAWRYLTYDPVASAANGFLTSPAHRHVLDNSIYKYWGFGIYTELPEGVTDELQRRWWFTIWLSSKAIGPVSTAQPSEIVDKRVSFGVGTHYGYVFDYKGEIKSSKALTLSRTSHAMARGRGRIPNRPGVWLLMRDGYFTDHWVLEEAFYAGLHTRLT